MPQKPKRTILMMTLLCIVIGLAAIAVGVVAVAKEEYIIAAAMLLVAAWQIPNYTQWKKSLKSRPDFSEAPSTLFIQDIWHWPITCVNTGDWRRYGF